ncbi:MAG: epoxyqueuosine reductase QueH [Oscillospiraceae bacterium]|nr:epoxyqueuosine reductase QueH [Oscillospiraceae bacterium]
MSKTNYMHEFDEITAKSAPKRPRLLLHSCCGPCSSSVLELLTKYYDVTLLWYNPNLYPQEEFDRRFAAQLELIEKMGLTEEVPVLAESRKHEDYLRRVEGLENEPEGGARCTACFRMRLLECARLAAQYGFDYFCTTLTVSRHKDAVRINALGEEVGKAFGVKWLPSDFKKRGGEQRSQQLAAQHGIYRQNYCGCEFSLRGREGQAEDGLEG